MNEKKKSPVNRLTFAAMFVAIGLLLPFMMGHIHQLGSMFLPMHIPVLLCGLICGWEYGLGIGFILPLLRYILVGMPPLFPSGIAMAFELATYGAVIGLLYSRSDRKNMITLYRSMIGAMLAGRVVWGVVQMLLLGIGEDGFTWKMFMAGAFLDAAPGIILQLILIPAVMVALNRVGLVKFDPKKESPERAEDYNRNGV